jgi:hypothetical protein
LIKFFKDNVDISSIPPEVVEIIKKAPGLIKTLITLGLVPPNMAIIIQPFLSAAEHGQFL